MADELKPTPAPNNVKERAARYARALSPAPQDAPETIWLPPKAFVGMNEYTGVYGFEGATVGDDSVAYILKATSDARIATARNDVLEALKPFAAVELAYEDTSNVDGNVHLWQTAGGRWCKLTYGDIRKAKDAIRALKTEQGEA